MARAPFTVTIKYTTHNKRRYKNVQNERRRKKIEIVKITYDCTCVWLCLEPLKEKKTTTENRINVTCGQREILNQQSIIWHWLSKDGIYLQHKINKILLYKIKRSKTNQTAERQKYTRKNRLSV